MMPAPIHQRVSARQFARGLTNAWTANPRIAENCEDYRDARKVPTGAECFVAYSGRSGYILDGGHLTCVWSTVRGRGDTLVSEAVARGAYRLDCFAGHLSKLYARHGFYEIARDSNWEPGGPDVVYMQHD